MAYKGVWAAGSYAAGDEVFYNWARYRAVRNTSAPPTETAQWTRTVDYGAIWGPRMALSATEIANIEASAARDARAATMQSYVLLALTAPAFAGERKFVVNDFGTHTDPETGRTGIPNSGLYEGVPSRGLWRRLTIETGFAPEALAGAVRAALATISVAASLFGSGAGAVNAAIDAVATLGGGNVLIDGEYVTTDKEPIVLRPGVVLSGIPGRAVIRRADDAPTHHMVTLSGEGDYFGLFDIVFDGNRRGQPAAGAEQGDVIRAVAGSAEDGTPDCGAFVFSGCTIRNFSHWGMGLQVSGFKSVRCINSEFTDGGGNALFHPIYFRRVQDTVISACVFRDNVGYANIKVMPASAGGRVSVIGCIVDGGGRGIYVCNAEEATVTGCVVTGCSEYGIGVGRDYADDTVPKGVTITGNTVDRCANGFSLYNCGSVVVSGNKVSNCSAALVRLRGMRDVQISGNTFVLDDLAGLAPDNGEGHPAAALSIDGILLEDGPNDAANIRIGPNAWRDYTRASSTMIRCLEPTGTVSVDPRERDGQALGWKRYLVQTGVAVTSAISPDVVIPQGQRSGTGVGLKIQSQGTGSYTLRADPFDGLADVVRLRQGGDGGAALWWLFSAGDSTLDYIGFNGRNAQLRFGGPALKLVSASGGGAVVPGADNAQSLGGASTRWSTVHAGTAAINTSDGRLKRRRGGLSDVELDAWGDVRPCIYQWLDAIAGKGEAARLHAGFIAQEVATAFAAHGLDPTRYALWCRDEVTATRRRTERRAVELRRPVTRSVLAIEIRDGVPVQVRREETTHEPVVEDRPIVDEAGRPVLDGDGNPRLHPVPVTEMRDVEIEETVADGYRLGLRVEQCLVFETAWLRRELERRAPPAG